MADHQETGILSSLDDQLSDEKKKTHKLEIINLESCLRELTAALGLTASSFSVRQKIMALISSSIVELDV